MDVNLVSLWCLIDNFKIFQFDMELINLLTTNVPYDIETSQLFCRANQLTGFYMMETLVVKRLRDPFPFLL